MGDDTVTCPRCLRPAPPDAQFCPHCGLAELQKAVVDTAPLDVTVGRRRFTVLDRLAVGSVCNIYRCRFRDGRSNDIEGVLKVARDARANDLLVNETHVLRGLHEAPTASKFSPFLPVVEESFELRDDVAPARQANVLRTDRAIGSPDEMYSLAEVRAQYPGGLDARDVAWMWRRLLSVLGFAHSNEVAHGAVLPMHVMIEPREHKLVLIDWCSAARDWRNSHRPAAVINGGYLHWYKPGFGSKHPPTPALDVTLGARCMIELLGGDPVAVKFPSSIDQALQRYFGRCIGTEGSPQPEAWRLLEDFDRLIEALWGPRKFRVLKLTPRRAGGGDGA